MALPTPPPVTTPIPNSPFFSPPSYFTNPYYPIIVGSGLSLNPATSVLTSTGGGGAVSSVTAGAGISVTPSIGNVVVSNAGVTSLIAGAGVTLSGATGAITISASGGGGGVTSITAGTGLTGGTITTTGTVALANTAVTPGSYTNSSFTVDAQGRLTAASNGSIPVLVNDFNAKGDLLVGTADNAFTALGVGTDDFVLTADATCASGVKWAAVAVDPATPLVEGIVYGCTDCTNFNYGLGDNIFGALTTGTLNIAIGTGALATTDTGTSNTAVGIGALFGNTTGIQNVALGQQTLFTSTTAGLNTAIGSQALQNTTGNANTALGNFAGNILTTGCGNILIGNQAGGAGAGALDTGCDNVVIGNCVSVATSSGNCQLAIGTSTFCWLSGTSTGAIKPGAGIIDCAASTGTAGQVLMSNGANAICWGAAGGASAATPLVEGILYGCSAASNVSVGRYALQSVTTGINNVAVGCEALCSVTSGISNTALGAGALINATGDQNTSVGSGALYLSTTGGFNTALGNNTMVLNTTGCCNTGLGQGALYNNSAGSRNVAVGAVAGNGATGSCNVFLGACSSPSAAGVNNEVDIYNGSVTARFQGAASGWSFVSDVRDKRNVTALPVGLGFINALQPRQFEWDIRDSEVDQGKAASGFIAQEVDAVVESHSAQYLGLVDKNNPEQFTLAQTNLIPVLVKAIQELSAKVEALEAKLGGNG